MKTILLIAACALLTFCSFPGDSGSRFAEEEGNAAVGISIVWPWDSMISYDQGEMAWTYPSPPRQKYLSIKSRNEGHNPLTSPEWWEKR